ncbi:MAG: alpha/beta fold hydrolase [Patescibacteria group bacterium]
MKKVVIIHGWGADPNSDWFPWLKGKLEERGFSVFVPAMPNTDNPKIKEWVDFLKDNLSPLDEDTYLIGHSIGCQTIMRYLGSFEEAKVVGIILVAPWFSLMNLEEGEEEIAKPWLETPIDFEKVKRATENIIALFSDNDSVVPIDNEKKIKEVLGAKTIIYKNKGHFNAEDGVKELPEILEFIK